LGFSLMCLKRPVNALLLPLKCKTVLVVSLRKYTAVEAV
jgi:hypothetical protein